MSFQESAQRTVDSVFAHHGLAATYTPPGGGAAVPCTVLVIDQDKPEQSGFAGRPPVEGTIVEVRRSEVASPAAKGKFTVGSDVYTVVGNPKLDKAHKISWQCMTG